MTMSLKSSHGIAAVIPDKASFLDERVCLDHTHHCISLTFSGFIISCAHRQALPIILTTSKSTTPTATPKQRLISPPPLLHHSTSPSPHTHTQPTMSTVCHHQQQEMSQDAFMQAMFIEISGMEMLLNEKRNLTSQDDHANFDFDDDDESYESYAADSVSSGAQYLRVTEHKIESTAFEFAPAPSMETSSVYIQDLPLIDMRKVTMSTKSIATQSTDALSIISDRSYSAMDAYGEPISCDASICSFFDK
jgi:hypothetical protein